MRPLVRFVGAAVVLAIGLAADPAAGQARKPQNIHDNIADATNLDCTQCHDCAEPRPGSSCLKPCPSHTMTHMTAKHQLSEAPETLLLDRLAAQYRPVTFNHKRHASMAEMGNDCATCHHFSPPGRIPPCAECHGEESTAANLRQPSLKGAYHRQCLSCHREWSHDTKCVVCHLPADLAGVPADRVDSTDIMGVPHPIITVPEKRVYQTPYSEGPVVTFYHDEHIDLFDLACANCHKKENCSYCHDLEQPARFAKSQEEVHGICNDCHRDDPCRRCHDTSERPGFSHQATGFTLSGHHRDLNCRACHPTGKRISRISRECIACHAGWKAGTFSHTITGLQLDATHADFDCEACHLDFAYDEKPDCSTCHDDNRTHREAPPGVYVKPARVQKP
ncbi:MAG TPA: cytochrome c3 family protein [candidate division Zixibacteria bacterium]|nr:hypothetical protein [candidate division Zixibacteria bacterium]MDD4918376.1 cytochrome c3 family protein [candidate division Zixibacteria bacterium]MDM7973288.1 cytochrome c3 family protein [candidate division Zixibacteria bacterium]HOD66029.1 cytochrome c3 family protein [candidate division Zixibacteria bacterium]HPM38289.1 cytochrome c3 family protein [candidate division Zixibacteria bacterium]